MFANGATAIILVIGAIAIIAGSIAMCVLFLGKNADKRDTGLGSFLHFDNFYIQKILQIFNVIAVVAITVVSICMFLTSTVSGGISGFFGGLISGAIFFFVSQLLNRMIFEQIMLMVSVTTDVKALRVHFVGKAEPLSSPSSFDGSSANRVASAVKQAASSVKQAASAVKPANSVATPVTPVAEVAAEKPVAQETPVAEVDQQYVHPSVQVDVATSEAIEDQVASETVRMEEQKATWDCPCGKTGNSGKFCTKCGTPRP